PRRRRRCSARATRARRGGSSSFRECKARRMNRAAAAVALVCLTGCSKPSGDPDPCALLRAAKPEELLRAELGPDRHIYGLCRVPAAAAPAGPDEKSVCLEIRRDAEAAAVASTQEFWDHEGNGVGYQGGVRENLRELNGPGRFSVWVPIDGGLQLFSYWDRE